MGFIVMLIITTFIVGIRVFLKKEKVTETYILGSSLIMCSFFLTGFLFWIEYSFYIDVGKLL